MAHKKAQGSTANGRDSNAKRLGVKLFGGQKAIAGNIILRQKGNKFWSAEGTKTGRDFTIFAINEGTVKFTEKKRKRYDGRVYKDIYVSVV
ncbi:MAG: 50S ribosomal protein L27 [Candidatus Gracilibacteria bacterium]|nr:50S ribosomal protein L27 [Candidatus Gracilibacteria bacterium]